MFYKKEIDDYALIQYIILYTLSSVKKPIGYDMLINLVIENCNITYTDFQIALSNLVENGYARTFESEGKPMYALEEKGGEANEVLYKKIPVYIREPLYKAIRPLFLKEAEKNRVRSTIIPVRNEEFCASMGLYEDDETPLLDLTFYAGKREEASSIAERFSKNPDKYYEKILKILTEEENNEND